MQLRDYQSDAVEFLIRRGRAFVQAPAGSGKTVIAAAALARILRPGMRVGWLANTKEQVEQAVVAIGRTPGPDGVDFKVNCAAAEPDFRDRDVIVIDESHHLPAVTWWQAVRGSKAVLWGFSATPFGNDPGRNELMREVFREFLAIERSRVELSGHIERGKVYMHDIDLPGQYDREIDEAVGREVIRRCHAFPGVPRFEHERRAKWQITQEFVQANEDRNACAASLASQAATAGESVLVLVHSIEHGEKLADRIPGAAVCHSKLGSKVRARLIDEFRSGERRVLCATSLADEGLDVPRASRLVLVAGGRSAGRLEQRAGRILRPFKGKSGGIIHDFLDAGCCFALAQARARFRVYEKLGYEPEILCRVAVRNWE